MGIFDRFRLKKRTDPSTADSDSAAVDQPVVDEPAVDESPVDALDADDTSLEYSLEQAVDQFGRQAAAADDEHGDFTGVGTDDVPSVGGVSDGGASDDNDDDGNQPAAASISSPAAPARRGLFAALRSGLKKTGQLLKTDIRDLFRREGRLVDDAFLDELTAILIRTDMGTAAARRIVGRVRGDFLARVVHMDDVLATVRDELRALLDQPDDPIRFAESGPTVIMVCGVNGSGKTTSIAKLARHFRSQGRQVVLGAADTFRAAAVEQLTVWAARLETEIVTAPQGTDPASVAHRAVARTLELGADVCIVDTAGRLQTQRNLMQELSKIQRVLAKQVAGAPHEVLLVLDATAGQNAISQARGFTDAVQCTGIVLAKLDGTAKGGVVVPIRKEFGLPVKFVGLGEKPEDLAPFNADSFVAALFEDAAG